MSIASLEAEAAAYAARVANGAWQIILNGGDHDGPYSFRLARSMADKRVHKFTEGNQLRQVESYFFGPIDPQQRFADLNELAAAVVAAEAVS